MKLLYLLFSFFNHLKTPHRKLVTFFLSQKVPPPFFFKKVSKYTLHFVLLTFSHASFGNIDLSRMCALVWSFCLKLYSRLDSLASSFRPTLLCPCSPHGLCIPASHGCSMIRLSLPFSSPRALCFEGLSSHAYVPSWLHQWIDFSPSTLIALSVCLPHLGTAAWLVLMLLWSPQEI